MKKTLLLILLTLIIGCAETKKIVKEKTVLPPDFEGKVSQTEIDYLTKTYFLGDKEILIINYKPPRSHCHFNNYQKIKTSQKWWNKFYSEIDLPKSKVINIYSEASKVSSYLNNKTDFKDYNNYLLNKFFLVKKDCWGLIMFHKNGNYIQKLGHYYKEDILAYKARLKNN